MWVREREKNKNLTPNPKPLLVYIPLTQKVR
jgi:hypothetical protein